MKKNKNALKSIDQVRKELAIEQYTQENIYDNYVGKTTLTVINYDPHSASSYEEAMRVFRTFIKKREDGCHEWIGSYEKSMDGNLFASLIVNRMPVTPCWLLYPDLSRCNICGLLECDDHLDQEYRDLGRTCKYDFCYNKDHIFIIKDSDMYRSYLKGMTVKEFENFYGLSSNHAAMYMRDFEERKHWPAQDALIEEFLKASQKDKNKLK